MATNDSTASDKAATESQWAKRFPINTDPFSFWFNDEAKTGAKWAVNDENGGAMVDVINYETAEK